MSAFFHVCHVLFDEIKIFKFLPVGVYKLLFTICRGRKTFIRYCCQNKVKNLKYLNVFNSNCLSDLL